MLGICWCVSEHSEGDTQLASIGLLSRAVLRGYINAADYLDTSACTHAPMHPRPPTHPHNSSQVRRSASVRGANASGLRGNGTGASPPSPPTEQMGGVSPKAASMSGNEDAAAVAEEAAAAQAMPGQGQYICAL